MKRSQKYLIFRQQVRFVAFVFAVVGLLACGDTQTNQLQSTSGDEVFDMSSDEDEAFHALPPPLLNSTLTTLETNILRWTKDADADYYAVYRSSSPSTDGLQPITSVYRELKAQFEESRDTGETYYYWVKSCRAKDRSCSDFSNVIRVAAFSLPLKIETSFSSIYLHMPEDMAGIYYYEIYRHTGSQMDSLAPRAIKYANQGNIYQANRDNNSYYYRVKACDLNDRCSRFSDAVIAEAFSISLNVQPGISDVVLSWDQHINFGYYELHQFFEKQGSEAESADWSASDSESIIFNQEATTVSQYVVKRQKETMHYDAKYRVRACDLNDDCSGFSNVVTVKGVDLKLSLERKIFPNVKLRWDGLSLAKYYEIYRSKTMPNSDGSPNSGVEFVDKIDALGFNQAIYSFDDKLSTVATHYYWFKACDARGCTDFSNMALYAPFPINDTGMNWSGMDSNMSEECVSSHTRQDCHQGRDAEALSGVLGKVGGGNGGFDFTKLSVEGKVLGINAEDWACVRDNRTSLVWEVKTEDNSSIHYKSNTYQWGGISAIGRDKANSADIGHYYNDWNKLVNGANQKLYGGKAGRCGLVNWRVPTVSELYTIASRSHGNYAAKDAKFFPHNQHEKNSLPYWTASPTAESRSLAMSIGFHYGSDANSSIFSQRNQRNYVRLVSGGRSAHTSSYISDMPVGETQKIGKYIVNEWSDSRYLDHQDGTVTDTATGLMWQKCSLGMSYEGNDCVNSARGMSWRSALLSAETENTAGHGDWRVPNIHELWSLVAHDRHSPSINASIFPNTPSDKYWSSTPSKDPAGEMKNEPWYRSFIYGYDYYQSPEKTALVRLVRLGQ